MDPPRKSTTPDSNSSNSIDGLGNKGRGSYDTLDAARPPRSLPSAMWASAVPRGNAVHPSASPVRQGTVSPTSTIDYAEIEQKQSELRHAVEYRVTALEKCLAEREEEIAKLKYQLQKMEEDYQFNYNLIAERDAALGEASSQLQRLYRELKQATTAGGSLETQLESKQKELQEVRDRLRECEEEKDACRRRLEKEFAVKEEHLFETVQLQRKELEEAHDREHKEYLAKVREFDKQRQEMEGRHQTTVKELKERFTSRLEAAEAELEVKSREADDKHKLLMEEQKKVSAAQQQQWILEQRCQSTAEELKGLKQWIEDRQGQQQESQALESIASLEQALREESRKSSRLDLERTRLQSELVDVQERLQRALKAREADSASHMKECQELRQNYEAASAAMEELRRKWSETEHRLQATVLEQAKQSATTEAELRRALETALADKTQLEETRVLKGRLEHEVEGLRQESRRWREEAETTGKRAVQEKAAAEEKILSLERQLQEVRQEYDTHRSEALVAQERYQTEASRLTRELHASEAARSTLEDQYHLLEASNHQSVLVASLRSEKENLTRQVEELTRVNGEIQQQVAAFTAELQNDPLVAKAKETQQRVQTLQGELLAAKEELETMKDSLQDKEEEIARYQLEVLRAQVVVGSPIKTDGKESAVGVLTQQYETLRQSYQEVRQQLEKERRRRDRANNNNNNNSINMSSDGEGEDGEHHATPAPSYPSIKEAEVWRQKSLQLEQHVRTLLAEREKLKKEVTRLQSLEVNLQSEKQSLLNLNALLKSQLREACRVHMTSPSPARASPPTSLTHTNTNNSNNNTNMLATSPMPLAVEHLSGGLNRTPPTKPALASSASRYDLNSEHNGENHRRLATLEDEINAIKQQIQEGKQRYQNNNNNTAHNTTRSPSSSRQNMTVRKSVNQSRSTVRKGDMAVRNYAQPFESLKMLEMYIFYIPIYIYRKN
ncbi:200 kDa antigen p200 [Angomonas deanei]|uniref:Uncharacterized protein n=1 Tax=Angomonas deanei TaxID=59799 RepID=A0A7G2CR71_9TRYP|nr:200 kDa antigen p200 [Angomonas deanei]CAD2222316.1 hypothetical protein, conserved [Angomonas deanei]|eukprot:EPY31205.1 200 kDa antigen p200 [Angomonas deanei]